MRFRGPRGTNDFFPDRSTRLGNTIRAVIPVLERYGLGPMETPIFEDSDLFIHSIGGETDIVTKEMYTFLDRKGRSLTLRPEGTAGVARAYIEHQLQAKGIRRLYYVGPMFRYERPQAGRYRQFYQLGCEIFDESHPLVDVEVIDLFMAVCEAAGLADLEVRVNSVGCEVCRPPYGRELRALLAGRGEELCGDCQRRLATNPLRVLDCKKETCQSLFASVPQPAGEPGPEFTAKPDPGRQMGPPTRYWKRSSVVGDPLSCNEERRFGAAGVADYVKGPNRRSEAADGVQMADQGGSAGVPSLVDRLCEGCATHFAQVRSGLEILGIRFRVDPRLVRGLDYYTKTAFEVLIPGHEGAQNAVGGGGRYDLLVGQLGGAPTPAIGFAIGLERLLMLQEGSGVDRFVQARRPLYIAILESAAAGRGLELAARARRLGLDVVMDLKEAGLKKQLQRATRVFARAVVIMGENELAQGLVSIKDMDSGSQESVKSELALGALEALWGRAPGA